MIIRLVIYYMIGSIIGRVIMYAAYHDKPAIIAFLSGCVFAFTVWPIQLYKKNPVNGGMDDKGV